MARMTAGNRRLQITQATLEVVATHGVQNTTVARIAEAAGISPAAIYRHFPSRNDLLLAAMDTLYDQIREVVFESSHQENIVERLRSISHNHTQLISSGSGAFIYPLFEFLAAPPEAGLREGQGSRQLGMIRFLAGMVEEGKAQGSIRADVDSEQVAWALHAIYWAEDIAHLMGLDQFATAGRSTTIINDVLARISADRPTEELGEREMRKLKTLLERCPLVDADS